ncbi:MAG: acyl-CoA desaturase [Flavobacteriales bacterium]|nr:acyl-CoA desaturase [Flavobacteriales bacterium]
MTFTTIKFNTKNQPEFVKELRNRVNNYFKENKISKYANTNMVIKTVFMLSLYFIPYFLILFNITSNSWITLSLWLFMGIGMAGIGFSIMHDANHGAYSKNKTVNKYLGFLINLIGGSSVNWKIQHNVLHHTYTNIHEHDEDMGDGGLMRFSYHQKRLKAHRFQQFYAWFLYSLITVSWSIKKDFIQLERYNKKDFIKTQNITYSKAKTRLIFAKIFYLSYVLVLPLIFSTQAWWVTILFYLAMHLVCGFVISIIFQLAHIVSETEFPLPSNQGSMENNFAVHQLYTTANFAKNNRILSWFIGGLNFQIEHHLFPNICHIHYRKISSIVKQTAKEYNVPYHGENSLFKALYSHGKLLSHLGKNDFATVN